MKQRLNIKIEGIVQGVGFRPFVYLLALSNQLNGWILNSTSGVTIEVEGTKVQLDSFLEKLDKDKPEHSIFTKLDFQYLEPVGYKKFEIKLSSSKGSINALILPDQATCPECLREVFDPENRRFLYPFTNCTHCGPRYTIIKSLPYDRPNTSMSEFKLCEKCEAEYLDPLNRRFHAQPNACPNCGPQLELLDSKGNKLAEKEEALNITVKLLKEGKILAVKGLGGFHLMADANKAKTIAKLRERKQRPKKPFALFFPDLREVEEECIITQTEKELLESTEAPILLLKRKKNINSKIDKLVAPDNPTLGIMLPYTPFHHILLKKFSAPLIATSANLSSEPICFDINEAFKKLSGIADYFLTHNRVIIRPVDDSIVRFINNKPIILRRSRGYAPFPISLPFEVDGILAMGTHLKNTVALGIKNQVIVSQHIGDLENQESVEQMLKTIQSFQQLYPTEIKKIVHDLHPEYFSSIKAGELQRKFEENNSKTTLIPVQHHQAHIASCMAENQLKGEFLGISWDGTGLGTDNKIWGGEFFKVDNQNFKRVFSFQEFKLPGSEKAIREPIRIALALLYQIFGEKLFSLNISCLSYFSKQELNLIKKMLIGNLNSPDCCSVGRLFDSVSALIGLCLKISFEGEAAIRLEHKAVEFIENSEAKDLKNQSYPVLMDKDKIDWKPMIKEVIENINSGLNKGLIAFKFHNWLVDIILMVIKISDQKKVILSGGCFQNKLLLEILTPKLEELKIEYYLNRMIPLNDGGLALGQIYFTALTESIS